MSLSKIISIPPEIQRRKLFQVNICVAIALLTFIVYWPVRNYDFVNFDDDIYVFKNAFVQSGLGWNSVRQAFTSELVEKSGFWHPLTWLSLMLDYQAFGLNAHIYHMTNLMLHVFNTILLFLVFRRMTKVLWQSAFIAILFAIHPLHVESVAWVAERKDVLSAFFWMLTMGAYIFYAERPGWGRYLLTLFFFILGLMAKPMLVSLPLVLLLIDYWPLNRFRGAQSHAYPGPAVPGGKKGVPASFSWLILEKVPLVLLSGAASWLVYATQQHFGVLGSPEIFPVPKRMANAVASYVMYIVKMIWPSNLTVYYPYLGGWHFWQVLGAILLLVAVTAVIIWKAKRFPYLTTGWLWYAGTLVPVIGLVQVGSFSRADRYTYIPLIGMFIMLAWGVPELLGTWRYRKEVLITLLALSLSCFSIVTRMQVGYWQNSITLFDHALEISDHNSLACNNRGAAYADLGNYKRAMVDYDRAIKINPNNVEAYFNRGAARTALGDYKQAIEDLDKTIDIITSYNFFFLRQVLAEAYYRRGNVYNIVGNGRQAIVDYGRAIEINPQSEVTAYYNRGVTYRNLGNYRQAINDFDRAIEINPGYAEAYNNRGYVYKVLGNYRQAISDFDRAVEINPGYANAYNNRAATYKNLGRQKQAIEDLKTAARFGDEDAQNMLRSQRIKWKQ